MIYRTEISSEKYRAVEYFNKLVEAKKIIEVKNVSKKRSLRQNNALHLYFQLLSEALNDGGFDMRAVIKDGVDIPFTPQTVKSHLWSPIQKAYLEKTSTTELKSEDINLVYDILNKHIGSRTGVFIPFPNRDYNLEY